MSQVNLSGEVMEEIKVSVAIITYGHEKYIKRALDSVIDQEVNFKFEIVIGEDCSPDGTSEILLEYKERYPEMINLVLHKENVGATRNLFDVFQASRGQYIALLEGDDYWIDSNKLKKQVEFLDNKNEYFAVSHVIEARDAISDEYVARYPDKNIWGRDVTISHFLDQVYFSGTACMFRNNVKEELKTYELIHKAHRFVGDFTYCFIFLNFGKVFVLDDCMAVYRVRTSKNSDTNYNSTKNHLDRFEDHIKVINAVSSFYNEQYDFTMTYVYHALPAFTSALKSHDFRRFSSLMKTIPKKHKPEVVMQLFKSLPYRKFFRVFNSKK